MRYWAAALACNARSWAGLLCRCWWLAWFGEVVHVLHDTVSHSCARRTEGALEVGAVVGCRHDAAARDEAAPGAKTRRSSAGGQRDRCGFQMNIHRYGVVSYTILSAGAGHAGQLCTMYCVCTAPRFSRRQFEPVHSLPLDLPVHSDLAHTVLFCLGLGTSWPGGRTKVHHDLVMLCAHSVLCSCAALSRALHVEVLYCTLLYEIPVLPPAIARTFLVRVLGDGGYCLLLLQCKALLYEQKSPSSCLFLFLALSADPIREDLV